MQNMLQTPPPSRSQRSRWYRGADVSCRRCRRRGRTASRLVDKHEEGADDEKDKKEDDLPLAAALLISALISIRPHNQEKRSNALCRRLKLFDGCCHARRHRLDVVVLRARIRLRATSPNEADQRTYPVKQRSLIDDHDAQVFKELCEFGDGLSDASDLPVSLIDHMRRRVLLFDGESLRLQFIL